ncbi:winged helix-turn-helix domain-containing protein [Actinoallomurus iriomotensis]|uniref:DNA-binding response regulator n=1 Tax=Actinoallomurus iriomotensis TaxID=478107 RepID=A0A9W6VWA1_9ACTN|nr:response regulator transcription factor [Actinoallomurus iriomotensis]GLY82640.1 DNA-binding response regulator [Actinoallomurus iriomotensis]
MHTTAETDRDGREGIVLVVEHDPGVADLARLYLSREGFDVHVVTDPACAAAQARRLRPDAVVLDLSTGVGETLIRELGDTPVVCVVPDGETGTSPYAVPRPFSPRVLVAMVARALRGQAPDPPREGLLRAGQVTLDTATRTVTAAGAAKSLTATEFDLLAFLMERPGRVFTREQLLAAVWGSAESAGTRTVDVHIAQLRAKLGALSPLRTVRGIGYAADP